MFKHILLPTDGSELSTKAVKAGIAFAKSVRAKVTGVHAFPATLAIYYGELAWVDEQLQQQMREASESEGNKYLDDVQAAAKSAEVEFRRVLVESDSPWKAIVDTAQSKGCDLIVMAAHGRRGMAALVLGSETNKVLTHSKIPVLVYR